MIFPEVSNQKWLDDLIDVALAEDIGGGDVTTEAVIDDQKKTKAVWVAKQAGIIAGLQIAQRVFEKLDENIEWHPFFNGGDEVRTGETVVEFSGNCRAVLIAERTALNFAQRMSGIATKTNEIVRELKGFPAKILDTRKTVPGLRKLDKIAVKAGGGVNHRMGLYDLAMIKDNHIQAAGSISKAVERVRAKNPDIRIEVETTNLEEVDEALKSGADIIMLDNMSVEMMTKAVERIGTRAETEASGNITSKTIREVAGTGVNFISVGALTHSVQAFDISQRIKEIF
ncbi:carboxylating nicotinate-nucleotide diphosphorylase [Rhodohalobacter sp. 614A]|uniref:carboxylating nicotinate-nucleotide diphosphorylase n=1 Tax=Rhodohalobacter sp. 614A TaxID=2908649 RepID=UPI001F1872F1|nr:carboxylating nicotinate-nucleotide diphosphorylase [Rhodohalobacter sp. 614A]